MRAARRRRQRDRRLIVDWPPECSLSLPSDCRPPLAARREAPHTDQQVPTSICSPTVSSCARRPTRSTHGSRSERTRTSTSSSHRKGPPLDRLALHPGGRGEPGGGEPVHRVLPGAGDLRHQCRREPGEHGERGGQGVHPGGRPGDSAIFPTPERLAVLVFTQDLGEDNELYADTGSA